MHLEQMLLAEVFLVHEPFMAVENPEAPHLRQDGPWRPAVLLQSGSYQDFTGAGQSAGRRGLPPGPGVQILNT